MYKTLPNYASLLVCMLLPCESLWPGMYIFQCLHSRVSLFLPLSDFDTLCPFSLYLCVFPSVSLPDHHCSSLHSGRLWVCISAYTRVCLPPSLLFSASGHGLHLCLSCLLAPIYVGITKCACLSVSTFLFMSLYWACLWESRQTREAPMIYTLPQTRYVSEKTRGNDLFLYCLQTGLQLTYSMERH